MTTSMKSHIKTITKEELLQKMKKPESVQIVNVLDPQHYDLGFIKGSKKIPLDQLNSRWGELDKSKEVVTYCASYECPASAKAAELLGNQGFKACAYEGGIKEWTASGLPKE